MYTILTWIMSLVTGPLLAGALDFAKARVAAKDNADQRTIDLAVETLKNDTLQRQHEIALLTAEQGNWVTRWVRPACAIPVVYCLWRWMMIDPLFGLTSAPLKGDTAIAFMIVLTGYFGGRTVEKTASAIARAIANRR